MRNNFKDSKYFTNTSFNHNSYKNNKEEQSAKKIIIVFLRNLQLGKQLYKVIRVGFLP